MNNLGVKTALKKIEKNAAVCFSYQPQIVSDRDRVSIAVKDMPLNEVLQLIFRETVQYEAVGEQIILKESIFESQSKTIQGRVVDENNQPIPGVNVLEKGTVNGTVTDVDGKYSLSVGDEAVLVFTFVGYKSEEINTIGRTTLDVTLAADTKTLEELVVIGYGEVKRKDLTGATNAIGAKDFQKGVIVSPEQLMQGRVAGVQITQTSGEPGGAINVRIRGTSSVYGANQPLFVIDGVMLSGDDTSSGANSPGVGRQAAKNPLNFLNPNDIAGIDILKDASATAIYGSRGANGVVLITLKKGKGKGTLEYNTSLGVSNITKKYDLLNAQEYVAAGGVNQQSSTDWQSLLFRTGITNQHTIAYGGGDATGDYRFSFGYFNQQGIIKRSAIQRYSFGYNGSKKFIENKLTIASNINLSDNSDGNLPISENIGFEGDLIGNILRTNPTRAVYNPDGSLFQPGIAEINPLAFIVLSKDDTQTIRILGNIKADYLIAKNLTFKTVIGFDRSFSSRKSAYSRDLVIRGAKGIGRAYVGDVEAYNKLLENYFTYNKALGKFNLNALLGYSYQRFERSTKNISASNFKTSDLDLMLNNLASANQVTLGGAAITNSTSITDELQSFFGRVNTGFSDKYLLTATLRVDGSSKFGANNKYGYFPSFAAKWKLSEENFISKSVFPELALRVSYGLTGNQAIPHNVYDRRDRYSDWTINDSDKGNSVTGGILSPVAFNNPNLKWETTKSFNIGLDFAILKNKISGSIDFYEKHTNDLLFNIVSAQPAPTPFIWKNLPTDIQNRGVEISLGSTAIEKNNFSWDLLLNVAYNSNIIRNLQGLYDTGEIHGQGLTGAFAQRLAEGHPLFAFYVRDFIGFDNGGNSIYSNSGFQQFLEGNKSPLARVTGGLTNNFRYKSFDLSIFFNGVFGNYIYSNTANALFTRGSFSSSRNVTKDVINSGEGLFNSPDVSTRFLQKGDFVRLQNLSLSYQLPVNNKVISSLKIVVTGQNLLLFTKYTGQDPEVSTNKSINGIPSFGIDYNAYPRARTWTIGANFTF